MSPETQAYIKAKEALVSIQVTPVMLLIERCNAAIDAAEKRATAAEVMLEGMRPVWAQGWTSDSQAAQASSIALSELWELLEVKDQTAAIERLKSLLEDDI